MRKHILVCGAGGFIGHHLVRTLRRQGHWVRGVDLKHPAYSKTDADEFAVGNLCDPGFARLAVDRQFDEVYQLAADMGGAGYIFTGDHDAAVMSNSVQVNLNVLEAVRRTQSRRVFYSSSACVYAEHNQRDPDNPKCDEASAYPAAPDSDYGWEKLFSERLFQAHARNYGIAARIARYHNVFGPEGAWNNGREKAPAALCRKIAMAADGGEIEIWGDGGQTRSFLYIDECVTGTIKLMRSDVAGPLNIGSDRMISIGGLADMIAGIAGKTIAKRFIPGPLGVRGRNSDNRLIQERLGWAPDCDLESGIRRTYDWIVEQVARDARPGTAAAARLPEASIV
ncbi:MAG TPA: NAD-dependent epimerase/dehydratase family protein [Rhizomicrobium sp.]|jgi:GDP-D-mannose 3',5'-epimerase|nr:NAD-dependent epimerase/dehydratase family protein [Rhizomicrobium sp.]